MININDDAFEMMIKDRWQYALDQNTWEIWQEMQLKLQAVEDYIFWAGLGKLSHELGQELEQHKDDANTLWWIANEHKRAARWNP